MRRVSYKSVLDKVTQRATAEASANVDLATSMNVFINARAAQFWTPVFWPEWSPVERRQFRDNWATATSYGAGSTTAAIEVYHPASDRYYQSLHAANLGNAPATLSGGSYIENSAHWAESKASYTTADWAASTPYSVGNKVRNPGDGYSYQCITVHTSTGTFDATKFGILTPFLRNVSLTQTGKTEIAEVEGVYESDPRVNIDATRIRFRLETDGVIVRGDNTRPWLRFRKACPSWSGTVYAATTTYVVGDQVYYSTTGDWYVSILGGAGNAPTNATYWTRIDFPYVLRDCVPQGAYSDWLKGDGQNQKADAEETVAIRSLNLELDLFERQQGQTRNLPYIRQ